MINRQVSAVTGRPVRKRYVEAVRARSPMVYQRHQIKKDQEHSDKMVGLEKESMANREKWDQANYELGQRNLKLADKERKDRQKRAKMGQLISLGTAGGNLYFASRAANAAEEQAAEVAASASTPTPTAKTLPSGQKGGFSVGPTGTPAPGTGTVAASKGIFPTIKDGIRENFGSILAGGGMGYMAGKLVDSDDKWKNVAAGAGAGALTGWVASGGLNKLWNTGSLDIGNLAAGAASGLIGGLGGFFA